VGARWDREVHPETVPPRNGTFALAADSADHVSCADWAPVCSDGGGGDDAMEGVGHTMPRVVAPACGGQKLGKFSGDALAAGDHEHHVVARLIRLGQSNSHRP